MKLSLIVNSPGKSEGKAIPITLSQFMIGRDPQCHLRPVSAAISKRHCALIIRGDKAFVRDFESTNGTFVNDETVKGERELHHEDRLKVGPLQFVVHLELLAPVSKPTPPPELKTADTEDESVAAMLLALKDDDAPPPGSPGVDSEGVPTGSTVMSITSAPEEGGGEEKPEANAGLNKTQANKPISSGSTSTAAKAILEKYMRRPRG